MWQLMGLLTFTYYFRQCTLVLLAITLAACDSKTAKTVSSTVIQDVDKRAIIPLPQHASFLDDEVILGHRLFHDKRLSGNQQVSCANCHSIVTGGDDNIPIAIGVEGRIGKINSPTVLNSSLNFRQFWDGRAYSLEEQVEGPIHNKLEMDANWSMIIARLRKDPWYVQQFTEIYDSSINADNIKAAIANFERELITPNSPFDRYLKGDKNALSSLQLQGYNRFKSLGCISCHQGINIGGNMYQRIGIVHNYFNDRGSITEADYGLYNITKQEEDRFKFKVPSLRNIALTAPYFHDGQTPTLEVAIKKMAYYQLGEHLSIEDIQAIEAFLHTLTGEVNPAILTIQANTND